MQQNASATDTKHSEVKKIAIETLWAQQSISHLKNSKILSNGLKYCVKQY